MSVYFLQSSNTGLVKIGVSANPHARMANLSCTYGPLRLLGTVPGDRLTERAFHAVFHSDCVTGEWFLPNRVMRWLSGSDRNEVAARMFQRPESVGGAA